MKRVYTSINPDSWDNLVTKYPPDSKQVSTANFTAGTKNIQTDFNGTITKRPGTVEYTALNTPPKDQFEAIFSDGVHHLLTVNNGNLNYTSGDSVEHTVTSGYSVGSNFEFALYQDRVYFGNGVTDQVYDRTASYGGVSYSVPKTKAMGAQAPVSAPVVSLVTDSTINQVPAGGHKYKVTFLYYNSLEESNGSPSSNLVTNDGTHTSNSLASVPVGGYGVVGRNIYRDDNDGNFVLVGFIDNNTATTFTDTSPSGTVPIPTDNFTPPIFSYIDTWLDAVWVAGVADTPYTCYFSEAGSPDIFPGENAVICNQGDSITGLVVYAGRQIVFNRRSMGQILGRTPDTFFYDAIQSSVGCIDNRSIQIRVVDGVPLLIWLSDKGFYSYDGNSVQYISDPIEDIVNFNIQQSVQQKGSNTQTTEADFSGGTASPGISISLIPDSIVTKGYSDGSSSLGINPRRTWENTADWEGGSSLTNIATKQNDNTMTAPVEFIPTLASGTLGGDARIVAGVLQLEGTSDFTGQSSSSTHLNVLNSVGGFTAQKIAYSFIPARSGNVTSFSLNNVIEVAMTASSTVRLMIWSDSLGMPNTAIYTGSSVVVPSTTVLNLSASSISVALTGGTRYWIGLEEVGSVASFQIRHATESVFPSGNIRAFGNAWDIATFTASSISASGSLSYVFSSSPIPGTGSWVSPICDSNSDSAVASLATVSTAVYPSGTSANLFVDETNDPLFVSGITTQTISNPSGGMSVSLPQGRYFRLRLALDTTDNRHIPTLSAPELFFNTTATWISEPINTPDATVFNSLSIVDTIPLGTTVTLSIATSANNITYSSYTSLGSATPSTYAKVKVVITSNSSSGLAPVVSSINFTWTVVSTFESSAINTNTTPAGWDIFQSSFAGTVALYMRSSATLIGLSGATYFLVTSGTFPSTVPNLQYTQWKAILTSVDGDNAILDSVTIRWFIGNTANIRVASLFFNGRYYLSAALLGSTVNNILFVLDLKGKWRIWENLNIGTFSLFFNVPFYGDAVTGHINQFLTGLLDDDHFIPVDIRFKDLDFSLNGDDNLEHMKVMDHLVLEGRGTGASYFLYYSIDNGNTFTSLMSDNGLDHYTSINDSKNFYARFTANQSLPVSGKNIMIRIVTFDEFDIEVHSLKVWAYVFENDQPVITG